MEEEKELLKHTQKRQLRRPIVLAIILLAVIISVWLYLKVIADKSPVPPDIQRAVSFSIYYPKENNMPADYHLDKNSFKLAQSGVVLFSVSYGDGRSMVFSEEAKPASDVVDKFNGSAIPVHNQVSTSWGKGLIGAYGSGKDLRTLASLPITDGPWIIITAPSDINQTDLSRVLQSLTE